MKNDFQIKVSGCIVTVGVKPASVVLCKSVLVPDWTLINK